MARACRYMGISRQAYYKQCQCESRRAERDEKVIALVTHIRLRQPRLGTRQLQHLLRAPCSHQQAGVAQDIEHAVTSELDAGLRERRA